MNKKLKALISAVLAAVLVCLCIPFTAAAAEETATFDFTSLTGKGTGLDTNTNLKNMLNGCESTGSNYITSVTATKVYSGNGSGGNWSQAEGFLKLGTSGVAGVLTLTLSQEVNKVEIVCHTWTTSSNDTIKVNECSAVTAPKTGNWGTKTFEFASTNELTITLSKRGFIQSITVYFTPAGACEHTYDGCEDTTCNDCGDTRAALEHAYDGCEDTECNNCTAGNRTALEHEYTNDYDAKCNNCTYGDRTVNIPEANSTLDFATATELGLAQGHNSYTTGKYYVEGTIKEITNDEYGNLVLEDAENNTIVIWGSYDATGANRYDAIDEPHKVGDKVKVYGIVGQYNGTAQVKNGWVTVIPSQDDCDHTFTDCTDTTCDKNCGHERTAPGHAYDNCDDTTCNNCTAGNRTAVEHVYTNEYDATCNNCTAGNRTVTLPQANSTLDFATAAKLGAAQDHRSYTADKYYITGTVKTIGHNTYGNITIEDENGNTFYLYTVKDAQGNNYGYIEENKPAVGDVVTFYGPIGRYNETPQMDPAVVYVEVADCEHEYTNEYDATCDECGEPRDVTIPVADSTLDFATATKLGLAQGHNGYTSGKYYIEGVITEIYDTEYGNMYIEDENGNTFVVYGSYDATGANRYDAIDDPHEVGDKVKVYGIVGQYNGTAQVKNGWVTVLEAADNDDNQGGGTTPPPAGDNNDDNQGGGTTPPPAGDNNDDNQGSGTTPPPAGDNNDNNQGGGTTPPPATCPLVVGKGYTISGNNQTGKIYVTGGVTSGRFDASYDVANAATFYVEAAANAGEYYLYFMNNGTKTYIVMNDESTGAATTANKAEASVFEWNTDINTLVVALDSNNRGFGARTDKSYENFNTYDASGSYSWGTFTAVEGEDVVAPPTSDNTVVSIAVAIVALLGLAYVSKKH